MVRCQKWTFVYGIKQGYSEVVQNIVREHKETILKLITVLPISQVRPTNYNFFIVENNKVMYRELLNKIYGNTVSLHKYILEERREIIS